jgi:hypothetical protein
VYLNVVGPIMWHLWINQGTGNANFFYAMTLIFFLFQVRPLLHWLLAPPSELRVILTVGWNAVIPCGQGWLVRDCLTSASVLDDLMTQEEKQKTKTAQRPQTTPTLPTSEAAASATAKAIKVD